MTQRNTPTTTITRSKTTQIVAVVTVPVGAKLETVALEAVLLLLNFVFVVVFVILKVDLVVKTGIDAVIVNNCDKSTGSKTMRRQT